MDSKQPERRTLVIEGSPAAIERIRAMLAVVGESEEIAIRRNDDMTVVILGSAIEDTLQRMIRGTSAHFIVGDASEVPTGLLREEQARENAQELVASITEAIFAPRLDYKELELACSEPAEYFNPHAADIVARHARDTSNWRRNMKPLRRCLPRPGSR